MIISATRANILLPYILLFDTKLIIITLNSNNQDSFVFNLLLVKSMI